MHTPGASTSVVLPFTTGSPSPILRLVPFPGCDPGADLSGNPPFAASGRPKHCSQLKLQLQSQYTRHGNKVMPFATYIKYKEGSSDQIPN